MIKISHECPICLLEHSRSFNDYCYALVHLFDEYPDYKQFFYDSVKLGRTVLLDNSIFELEEAFNSDLFAKAVDDLRPTEYIIPDVLDDAESTIQNFKTFVEKYDLPGIKIGVVQGKTYSEFKECYQFMSVHADKIAISFNTKVFEDIMTYDNFEIDVLHKWCYGRPLAINTLKLSGVWNIHKPHHLLGCSLYKEFTTNKYLYRECNIVSLDTSNPIVAGIKGLRYNDTNGLKIKPSVKLFELINSNIDKQQYEIIKYNIDMFRKGLK